MKIESWFENIVKFRIRRETDMRVGKENHAKGKNRVCRVRNSEENY